MSTQSTSYKRKVFLISMVKNEEDVIESFVRYHSSIMDGMVILDNGSTDSTPFILNKLVEEGIPLYLIHDPSIEYLQSQKMTKLLHDTLNKFNPDFIFPLDGDEFLYSSNGQHPRKVIDSLDSQKAYYLKSITYVPEDGDDKNEVIIPKRIQHCFAEEWEKYYKIAVPKELISKHALRLSMGNHDVIQANRKFGPILKERSIELKIAHYPIRSPEQIMSKILIGWINNLCRYDRKAGQAIHWERYYQKIKNDKYFIHRNFKQIVNEYFFGKEYNSKQLPFKPLDLSICENMKLKYTNADAMNHTKNLLDNCENLALQYAELKRQILRMQGKL